MPIKRLRKIGKKLINSIPSSYVLMFHHVEEAPIQPRSKCCLATDRFYDIISRFPPQAYASVADVVSKRKKKIGITFDDGIEDVYRIAYPFLKERKIPFCIFVVTEFLDQPGYITTKQLLEMNADPLVTIGSHGITHNILKGMPEGEQIKELQESKRILEEKLGKPVEHFAYSHGQYDQLTLKHVRIYKNAYSVVSHGINLFTRKRWEIPRINMDSTVNIEEKIKQIGLWVKNK